MALPLLGASPLEIFAFLAGAQKGGARGALVTMTEREGSSARPLGQHMAVLEDGRYAGCFSGGCLEAAIVAEAQDAIRDGAPRTVRYGRGSKYIDLRLPCGGAIELLFRPEPPLEPLEQIARLLEARSPAVIAQTPAGRLDVDAGWAETAAGWQRGAFVVRHAPPLRLLVAGEGGEAQALVRLARAYGAVADLMSPDESLLGGEGTLLRSPGSVGALEADLWTAVVLLFHSHEWETALLKAALATPAFWIGAMGSRTTHAARVEALVDDGVAQAELKRVRGPIGLIPATRDPATLALSALAEIAGAYQQIVR